MQFDSAPQSPHPSQIKGLINIFLFGSSAKPRFLLVIFVNIFYVRVGQKGIRQHGRVRQALQRRVHETRISQVLQTGFPTTAVLLLRPVGFDVIFRRR